MAAPADPRHLPNPNIRLQCTCTYMHCAELAILIDLGTMHSKPGRASMERRTLPHYTVVTM
jgi:hypothetical protein